jgi:hypothetical protein
MRFLHAAIVLVGLLGLDACSDGGTACRGGNAVSPAATSAGGGGAAAMPIGTGASGAGAIANGASGGSEGASAAGAGAQGDVAGASAEPGNAGSAGAGTAAIGGSAGVDGSAGTSAAGAGGESGAAAAGSSVAGGDVAAAGSASDEDWWHPVAGMSWQWQIGGGRIDPSLPVDVFDIDWEQSASVVDELHQAGKKVICYVSVGSWEQWRPDAADFPASVLGNDYPGWPGERFVDIRAQALRDVMAKRFDACKAKGFDAVEPDNMDVFGNNSGFALTRADGIDYAMWLAGECHSRSLAVVQKNASEITANIESVYDGALTEDCYADRNWCSEMQPYVDADKPVFACEYDPSIFDAACGWGAPRGYSFILKDLDLTAPVTFCP